MATKNIEIQDSTGNIYYPHTDASIVKFGDSNVNATLSDMVYQTAGGSATATTLAIKGTLVNGYPMTFIASASNGGAATTINGKKLYKPGTTSSPNLIAGKAYTVWYNSTGDCFFIKASAEGDADVSNVLATKKFSNDNDTGLVGTMPNNGAVNLSLPINGFYTIPKGFHDGTGKVNQSIPTKAGTTINPSTSQQVIPAGQYLSGDQIIAAITGNATINDVIAGKVFSSANGINLVGNATIGSLGGVKYVDTTITGSNNITVNLGFRPRVIFILDYKPGASNDYRLEWAWLDKMSPNTYMLTGYINSQDAVSAYLYRITINDTGFVWSTNSSNTSTYRLQAWA